MKAPTALLRIKGMTRAHLQAGEEAFRKNPQGYDDVTHAVATERARAYAKANGLTPDEEAILKAGRVTAKEWQDNLAKTTETSEAKRKNREENIPEEDVADHSHAFRSAGKRQRFADSSIRQYTNIAVSSVEDLGRQAIAPLDPREGDPVDSFITLSKQVKSAAVGTVAATIASAKATYNRGQQSKGTDVSSGSISMTVFERRPDGNLQAQSFMLGANTPEFRRDLHSIFKPKMPFNDLSGNGHSLGTNSLMRSYVEADIQSPQAAKGFQNAIETIENLRRRNVGQQDILVMLSTRGAADPALMQAASAQFVSRDRSQQHRNGSTQQAKGATDRNAAAFERD